MTHESVQVEQYYDSDPAKEWARLDDHRTELGVTLRALREHLPPPPARILDIGGGPGRYAIALAEQGYSVTLLDLSRVNLKLAELKADEVGVTLADMAQANALDLSHITEGDFDAALLMGPLYHLLDESDRARAVGQALAKLKPGAPLFAAYITRYSAIRDAARQAPEGLVTRADVYRNILENGQHRQPLRFTSLYMAHPREVQPFMEAQGLTMLDLIGCEGAVSMIDGLLNPLTGEVWERWVELNYQLGKDPSLHGAAEHLLYVGRKN